MLHMIHEHLGNPKLKAINKRKDEALSTLRVMRTDVEKAAKNIKAWLDMAAHFNITAHHENKTVQNMIAEEA